MNENTKIELEKKLAKMPAPLPQYIAWQLDRIGELGQTTAEELINGTIDPLNVWNNIIGKARKKLGGNGGAIISTTIFEWTCKELHIDGVVSKGDFMQFCSELQSGAPAPAPVSESNGLDFDALFD